MLREQLPYPKHEKVIHGKRLAYVDEGEGDPIVFLHGNPTSSFLWRNVMPELAGQGRLIAPDLIGQGDSEKLPAGEGAEAYGFDTAYHYLEGLLEALGCHQRVTLVVHDWGSALGFHWARCHPDAVKGIAYMEAIVMPVTWEDWPEAARGIFKGFRSDKGEDLILNRNMFVEAVLPGSVIRDLSEAEMAEYRRPFQKPEDRQPTLNWPRDIPIDGEPAEMVRVVRDYADWLAASPLPKLFVNADPGSILIGRQREFCRTWPNQTEVTVRGNHFLQEDSPVEIGQAVARWLEAVSNS
ncbi:haloalkane dehalogenase [Alloalcanivorax xenomutans]|uniref:haloalkane dehalogenase n=1 Tax=Alloalcanivorax xenomutans TaxID=1094342 RepID=UPI003D9BCD09